MKRVNLVKYGFVRVPEEDFTDDSSRFQVYKVGRVRATKLVADGQVYLSISSAAGKSTLPHDIYSKLPHYHDACWKWNGVSVDSLTDQDLKDFYEACIAYEQEYEATEASIKYPTLEDIRTKAMQIAAKRSLELDCVRYWLKTYSLEAMEKFSSYEWQQVQEYSKKLMSSVKRFDPETFPQTILGQQFSFTFVKPDYEMQDSFWFRAIGELFDKYCMR